MLVEESLASIADVKEIVQLPPGMGAEDFAFYLQEAPGCFYNVGAGNKEKCITYPAHHPLFDVDESALKMGAQALAINAIDLLKRTDLHKK